MKRTLIALLSALTCVAAGAQILIGQKVELIMLDDQGDGRRPPPTRGC